MAERINYEAIFKRIDDILWKDAGCDSDIDYIEQTSWILFLKYLDDFEKENKTAAELSNKTYSPIFTNEFSWEAWAAPKKEDGSLDFNKAISGADLKDFVDTKLFPYLLILPSGNTTSCSPFSISLIAYLKAEKDGDN